MNLLLEQRKINCSTTRAQILIVFLSRVASVGCNLGPVALSCRKVESQKGVGLVGLFFKLF